MGVAIISEIGLDDARREGDPKIVRLFIIDESMLTYAGLKAMLADDGDIEIVGYARSVKAMLAAEEALTADVILVNALSLPGNLDTIVDWFLDINGPASLLLLLRNSSAEFELPGHEHVIGGVVLASDDPEILLTSIRMVAGGYVVGARPLMKMVPRPRVPERPAVERLENLTRRENDVLRLLAKGLKNAEIATELVLSESTVKSHVQNILRKLDLPNRASVVAASYQLSGMPSHTL
jgi:DNA-binding NarL/FixJ family response regulator